MDKSENKPLTKFRKNLSKEECDLIESYLNSEKYEDLDKGFDDLNLKDDEN